MNKLCKKMALVFVKSILTISLGLFVLFSCTKELSETRLEEPLSPKGEQFMELIKSSNQWKDRWNEIRKIGIPKPNDVLFSIFSCGGLYCIIPVLANDNKEIKAFAFYPLKPLDGGGLIADGSPEILLHTEINNDLKSRLLIKSQSYENWTKRGYSLSAELTSFDYKQYLRGKTKIYITANENDNIFYFDYIIDYTYHSQYDYDRIRSSVKNIILSPRVNYPPSWKVEYQVSLSPSYYFILKYVRMASSYRTKMAEMAEIHFSQLEDGLRFIPGVNRVEFMYYGSATDYYPYPPEEPDLENPCPHLMCLCGRYIESRLRYNACFNKHDFCPNHGDCTVEVQLNVSKTQLELGEKFRINLTVSPQDAICNEIALWIINSNGDMVRISKDSATDAYATAIPRFPGKYYIFGYFVDGVKYKEWQSEMIEVEFLAPSVDVLKNQPVFVNNLMPLWNETLAAANASGYQEFGGVLMMNTTSPVFSYTFERKVGAFYPYNVNPTIDLTCEHKEFPDPLEGGGTFGVMIFHTHPPLNKYTKSDTLSRNTGPSEPDINTHTNIPASVYDFDMPKHTSKDKTLPGPKLSIYGPTRATYMYKN